MKTDLRIIKTRTSLVNSIEALLNEMPFEEITVKKICEIANIRRATFYTHFDDKYELLQYYIFHIFENLPSTKKIDDVNSLEELMSYILTDIVRFLGSDVKKTKYLLEGQTANLVFTMVFNAIYDMFSSFFTECEIEEDEVFRKLTIHFHIRGIAGAIIWWINDDYPISEDDLIEKIKELIMI